MHITVYDVLSYLASGMTYDEILEDVPDLNKEGILDTRFLIRIPSERKMRIPLYH